MPGRINLLSGPRNISTAMMYSFAQRKDTTVVDEPLYAHYLKITGLQHPGRDEVLASQEADAEKVIKDILLGKYETPFVFFKQMTHHMIDIDFSFLRYSKNILLIRNPKKVLHSYSKVIQSPTLNNIGIQQSLDLFRYLSENNFHCFLVDADQFLKNPEEGLIKICTSCEIQFEKTMLQWKAGARNEDGIWAKYWYANVHQSTGFENPRETEIILPDFLIPVYNEARIYYEELMKFIDNQS
ncbi:MAG: hypothetical protein ACKVPJ_10380 [Chitinophagales bacterium]